MPELGKDIDKAKKKALEAIQSKIDEMGKAAYDIFLRAIEKDFDFRAGKIVVEKDFIKQLNRLTVDVLDLLQKDPNFKGPVSQFVKRFPAISDAITDFQSEVNGIKTPSFETVKKVINDEIIDRMLDNGLNQNFVQPLRNLIFQNATGGLSLSQARAEIKKYIQGGGDVSGKLGRYVEQTAQQAVSAYTGLINTKLLETFDYDTILQTGTLIDTSSPQCRFVTNELGGKLMRKDWAKFREIGLKNGLSEKATFDNLPSLLAHPGCRHGWYPAISQKLKEAV